MSLEQHCCRKACLSWGTSPPTIAMSRPRLLKFTYLCASSLLLCQQGRAEYVRQRPGTRPKFPSTSPLSRRPSMSRKICWMMTTSPPSWMATCQMRSSPQLVCEPSVAQGRLPSSELAVEIQNASMHPVEDRRERVGGAEQQPLGSFKTWSEHKIFEHGRGQSQQQLFLRVSAAEQWPYFV